MKSLPTVLTAFFVASLLGSTACSAVDDTAAEESEAELDNSRSPLISSWANDDTESEVFSLQINYVGKLFRGKKFRFEARRRYGLGESCGGPVVGRDRGLEQRLCLAGEGALEKWSSSQTTWGDVMVDQAAKTLTLVPDPATLSKVAAINPIAGTFSFSLGERDLPGDNGKQRLLTLVGQGKTFVLGVGGGMTCEGKNSCIDYYSCANGWCFRDSAK